MSMSSRLAHIFHACAPDLLLLPEPQIADTPFYRRPGTPGRYLGLSRSLRSRIGRRASSCECDAVLQLRPPDEHSYPKRKWRRCWKRHHRPAIYPRLGPRRSMLQSKPAIRSQQCHQALELSQQRKIFAGSPCAMDQPYMYTLLLGRRRRCANSGLLVFHDQRQQRGTSAGK